MKGGRMVWTGLVVAALGLSGSLGAAQQPQAPTKPKLVVEAAHPIQSLDGKDLYAAYCASCHGKGGKGDGPAAPALKGPVTDLTLLAKKNGGKYSFVNVEQLIGGRGRQFAAHGSTEMPIWGHIFYTMGRDSSLEMLRVKNLADYIESLQVK